MNRMAHRVGACVLHAGGFQVFTGLHYPLSVFSESPPGLPQRGGANLRIEMDLPLYEELDVGACCVVEERCGACDVTAVDEVFVCDVHDAHGCCPGIEGAVEVWAMVMSSGMVGIAESSIQPKPNPQPLRPLALVTDWRPHIGALRGLCTTSYDSPNINLGVLPIGCITPKSVSGNSVSGQLLELDVANHVRHVVNLVTVALRESNAPLIRVSDKVCGRSV